MALKEHIEQLQRIAERSTDPRKRELLLELLEHAQGLENDYTVETGDPPEAALLSMLMFVYSRILAEPPSEMAHEPR